MKEINCRTDLRHLLERQSESNFKTIRINICKEIYIDVISSICVEDFSSLYP